MAAASLHTDASGSLDALRMVTWYVVLLFGIPASLIVGPLGNAGTPATLAALLSLLLWSWYHLQRHDSLTNNTQPVRLAAFCFLIVMFVVYAHAMTRAIAPTEVSTADSSLLRLLALIGILLLANDGVASYSKLHAVTARLTLAGGFLGALALTQFLVGQPLVDRIQIPGLVWNLQLETLGRNDLYRVAATATHSIELGVVIAMLLPLAVTMAVNSDGARKTMFGATTAVMSLALFLTISRSALVSAVVAIAFMLPAWRPLVRWLVLVSALGVTAVVYFTVPGLLGGLGALFVDIENDPSALSRTNAYTYAFPAIERSPILGRGVGTFLPQYRILDNQYLLFLIEAGIVGMLALVGLFLTAVLAARRARILAPTVFDGELANALAAGVAAAAVGALFFDAFSFPMALGTLFLLLGLCGACLELARRASHPIRSGHK